MSAPGRSKPERGARTRTDAAQLETFLPPKLFFRIGEVANLLGVETHVIRYWEREFPTIRPTKSAKGQRVYSRRDVEQLVRVRDLLYRDGFTIAGAKRRLRGGDVENERESSSAGGPVAQETHAGDARSPHLAAEAAARSAPPAAPDGRAPPGDSTPGARTVRDRLLALRREVASHLRELEDLRR